MSPTIRAAVISDAAAISRLSGQLGYPSTVDDLLPRLQRLLTSSENTILVAELPTAGVVGWMYVGLQGGLEAEGFAEVLGFIVEESRRSEGIGRRLVCRAENWARDRGQKRIRVRSNVVREGAHRFYERLEFTKTKTQAVFDKMLTP